MSEEEELDRLMERQALLRTAIDAAHVEVGMPLAVILCRVIPLLCRDDAQRREVAAALRNLAVTMPQGPGEVLARSLAELVEAPGGEPPGAAATVLPLFGRRAGSADGEGNP